MEGQPSDNQQRLDRRFKRRKAPSNYFVLGRVFSTLWTEPINDRGHSSTIRGTRGFSAVRLGEQVFSKIRLFVVIREGLQSCSALPIHQHAPRPPRADNGAESNRTAYLRIHTGEAPRSLTDNAPAIRVNLDQHSDGRLDPNSVIDLERIHTIEHYVKACSWGIVHPASISVLLQEFNNTFLKSTNSIRTPGLKYGTRIKRSDVQSTAIVEVFNSEETAAAHETIDDVELVHDVEVFKMGISPSHRLQQATQPMDSRYPPLQRSEIRLLQMLSGSIDGEIYCDLVLTDLDQKPICTAISYAWGSSTGDCVVNLSGEKSIIGKNLWRFLQQLKGLGQDRSQLLWVDALCINQNDNSDRMQQVELMPRIYATAAHVVAWLGPSYGDSSTAMHELAKPLTHWKTKRNFSRVWTKTAGAAIRGLCLRPYWSRLWVFQELMLAQQITVMCGDDRLPWSCFREFLLEVRNSSLPLRTLDKFEHETVRTSPAMSIVEQATRSHDRWTLWSLLSATQDLRCSESRDRVYALLGVAFAGHEDIKADYDAALPALLNLVLKKQHRLQSPQTIEEILDQWEQLTGIFQVAFSLMFAAAEQPKRFLGLQDLTKARLISYKHKGFLLLRWALLYDHKTVVELLFNNGTIDSRTSLYSAARHGDIKLVALLLDTSKVDVHWRDKDGQSALHWAASRGHDEVVKLLLQRGNVDVHTEDDDGRTALHWAAMHGHASTLILLLDIGRAEVNRRDFDDSTPLHYGSRYGHAGVVRALLSTGKVDMGDKHRKAGHLFNTGQIDLADRDGDGRTLMHWAAESGQAGFVKRLLNIGETNVDSGDAPDKSSREGTVKNRHKGVERFFPNNDVNERGSLREEGEESTEENDEADHVAGSIMEDESDDDLLSGPLLWDHTATW